MDCAIPICTVPIRTDRDLVEARQRARRVAELLGFDAHGGARVATAASEAARSLFAGGQRPVCVEFCIDLGARSLAVHVDERGPARAPGSAPDPLGIAWASRLMERAELADDGGHPVLRLYKGLPRHARDLDEKQVARIRAALAIDPPVDLYQELHRQNEELAQALEQIGQRQAELVRLNRELDETNRGVMALYAELEDKADSLRRADELKSRFLSYISHEFRTPLNSILALTRLLQSRADGELTPEQEKQVNFIRRAADELGGMVDDLLDLAKVAAGKTEVEAGPCDVATLFGTLKGMLRPLVANDGVELSFEPPDGVPELFTDEGKISQILRNLVSNALKFTERGQVRVSAATADDGRSVVFTVADTGIGIPEADLGRIFEEFAQVRSPLQARVRGTGLGLPLSRKLAELLGGGIAVESVVGAGSIFRVTLPVRYRDPAAEPGDGRRAKVLVVDDDDESRQRTRQLLRELPVDLVEAEDGAAALALAARERPRLILLDLMMPGLDGFEVLDRLAEGPAAGIPVIVQTSKNLDPQERTRLAARCSAILSKNITRQEALAAVRRTLGD